MRYDVSESLYKHVRAQWWPAINLLRDETRAPVNEFFVSMSFSLYPHRPPCFITWLNGDARNLPSLPGWTLIPSLTNTNRTFLLSGSLIHVAYQKFRVSGRFN